MVMKYDLFELAYFFLRNTINCGVFKKYFY